MCGCKEDTYLKAPKDNRNQKEVLSRHAVQVNPQECKGNGHQSNVQMQESLIESMTNGRGGVHHQGREANSRLFC